MFKKLNKQDGFLHLQLIIAACAVIVGVALVGSYVISKSNAQGSCWVSQNDPVKISTTKDFVKVKWSYKGGSGIKYTSVKVTFDKYSTPIYNKFMTQSGSWTKDLKRGASSYKASSQFSSSCKNNNNNVFSATKSITIPAR